MKPTALLLLAFASASALAGCAASTDSGPATGGGEDEVVSGKPKNLTYILVNEWKWDDHVRDDGDRSPRLVIERMKLEEATYELDYYLVCGGSAEHDCGGGLKTATGNVRYESNTPNSTGKIILESALLASDAVKECSAEEGPKPEICGDTARRDLVTTYSLYATNCIRLTLKQEENMLPPELSRMPVSEALTLPGRACPSKKY